MRDFFKKILSSFGQTAGIPTITTLQETYDTIHLLLIFRYSMYDVKFPTIAQDNCGTVTLILSKNQAGIVPQEDY